MFSFHFQLRYCSPFFTFPFRFSLFPFDCSMLLLPLLSPSCLTLCTSITSRSFRLVLDPSLFAISLCSLLPARLHPVFLYLFPFSLCSRYGIVLECVYKPCV